MRYIHRNLAKLNQGCFLKMDKRSGRRKKISRDDQRCLVKLASSNPTKSAEAILNELKHIRQATVVCLLGLSSVV